METNEVAVKDSKENFFSDRQTSIYLAARKWRVEEETQPDVLFRISQLLPKHGWQKHKVVVMYPDQVIVLHIFRDSFRKQAIGFGVGVPRGFFKGNLTGVIVEEGPEDRVYIPILSKIP